MRPVRPVLHGQLPSCRASGSESVPTDWQRSDRCEQLLGRCARKSLGAARYLSTLSPLEFNWGARGRRPEAGAAAERAPKTNFGPLYLRLVLVYICSQIHCAASRRRCHRVGCWLFLHVMHCAPSRIVRLNFGLETNSVTSGAIQFNSIIVSLAPRAVLCALIAPTRLSDGPAASPIRAPTKLDTSFVLGSTPLRRRARGRK